MPKALLDVRAMIRNKAHRLMIFLILAMSAIPAFAQETEPVQLELDMGPLFSQINHWVTVLMPVLSIGFAIMIAIAIISFVGNTVVKAFRGG
jgi:hypothetical protein